MNKLTCALLTFFLLSTDTVCFSQTLSYKYLIEIGKDSFEKGKTQDALHYFTLARTVAPFAPEAQEYIDLIRRKEPVRSKFQDVSPDTARGNQEQTQLAPTDPHRARETQISRALDAFLESPEASLTYIDERAIKEALPSPKLALITQDQTVTRHEKPKNVITLSPDVKDKFPLTVTLSIEDYFVVKGDNISRVLVLDPTVASIEKKDAATVMVNGVKYGSSFVHVWDSQGRWTFEVSVVPTLAESEAQSRWQEAEAFTFWYNNDWRHYYRGSRFSTMTRQTLEFDQEVGMRGPTPYGDFDASLSWDKINKTEELNEYTIGLKNGNVAGFHDFTTRAFDFTLPFSDLTFPGNTLRGFMFASPAFNDTIEYAIIHGQQKSYFLSSVFTPALQAKDDAYIEGLRLGFFPRAKNSLYVNYARGYGKDRDVFLKEKVFSVQTAHKYDPLFVGSEFAYDESSAAGHLISQLRLPRLNLRMSLRDIEPNFVNITSRPPSMGEMGSLYEADWYVLDNVNLRSSLDVYRNRILFNPGDPDGLNYDLTEFLDITLPNRSSLNTSLYYNNDHQLSSPIRSLSAQSIYNKTVDIDVLGSHRLSSHVGYSFAQSINPLSPSSDYLRQGILTGFSLALTRDVSWYYNYNYSWLSELSSEVRTTPRVVETGLDISHMFNPQLMSNARFGYRREHNAEATHSFLSGENSFEGSVYLTYTPQPDVEFFCDGRVREVMPILPEVEEFTEADFRTGVRLTWESFFRWSPSTKITGLVFKDTNGNAKSDPGEQGVSGVKILIGPREVTSNAQGKFSTVVREKSVTAIAQASSIPQGYVFTTPNSVDIDTASGGKRVLNFGIGTQAGIYGIVFYDANGNNKFDAGDEPIERAGVTLDGNRTARTNSSGVYSFNGLASGTHTLSLDVNSLPIEYIPGVAVKKQIDVVESATANYNFPLQKK